jgi:hypothetical protein
MQSRFWLASTRGLNWRPEPTHAPVCLRAGRTSFRICSGRLYSYNWKVCRNLHTLRRPVVGIIVQEKLTGLPERVWLA